MRIFLYIVIIMFVGGCSTVEVAKEVTKATKSIKTSVDNMRISFEEDKKILEVEKEILEVEKEILEVEKEILEVEKEKEKKLVLEQKKIIKINFLNMTLDDIESSLGKPALSRRDGNTYFTRFDINNCRLFLFFNSKDDIKKIQYFEIRDTLGNLIIRKAKVQNCYDEFNLS